MNKDGTMCKVQENWTLKVILFLRKFRNKLSLKDCDEFFLQLKLIKLCCIYKTPPKFWKFISKSVLLWNISVNLFFFLRIVELYFARFEWFFQNFGECWTNDWNNMCCDQLHNFIILQWRIFWNYWYSLSDQWKM